MLSTASNDAMNAVWIHQISKRHSQAPFRKIKGSVQRVLFHPSKPNFFVAVGKFIHKRASLIGSPFQTKSLISIYDLSAQKLLKTLKTGSRWISSMDIHPTGDHLIVGGYDKKLLWFDLELGMRPYKILR